MYDLLVGVDGLGFGIWKLLLLDVVDLYVYIGFYIVYWIVLCILVDNNLSEDYNVFGGC